MAGDETNFYEDWTAQAGTTFVADLSLAGFDLTGYTASCVIRRQDGTVIDTLTSGGGAITVLTSGSGPTLISSVTITINGTLTSSYYAQAVVTAAGVGLFTHRLSLTAPSGFVYAYGYGKFLLHSGNY